MVATSALEAAFGGCDLFFFLEKRGKQTHPDGQRERREKRKEKKDHLEKHHFDLSKAQRSIYMNRTLVIPSPSSDGQGFVILVKQPEG